MQCTEASSQPSVGFYCPAANPPPTKRTDQYAQSVLTGCRQGKAPTPPTVGRRIVPVGPMSTQPRTLAMIYKPGCRPP